MIKYLFILFAFTLNAQSIWYVDNDNVSGTYNGKSWATAWTGLDSSDWADLDGVNWDLLSAGDTIYVSGGSSGKSYYNQVVRRADGDRNTFAGGNPVIVAPAYHSGHNGDVTFTNSGDVEVIFSIGNVSNVKFVNFDITDNRTAGSYGGLVYMGNGDCTENGCNALGDNDSLLTLENCNITGKDGNSTLIYFRGTKINLKNCDVIQPYNNSLNDQDLMGFSSGRGGYILDGCRFIYSILGIDGGAHRDILQFSNFGISSYNETVDIIIANCLIIHPYSSEAWTGLVYSSNPQTNTNWYIYNNILVSNCWESAVGGIVLNQPNNYSQSMFIYNNTIIMRNDTTELTKPLVQSGDGYVDTFVVKNNLVVNDSTLDLFYSCAMFDSSYYSDIDYNAYYEYGGMTDPFSTGAGFGNWTYAEWQSYGHDANAITGNSTSVTFTNKYDTNFVSYYTEAGRDLGVDLSGVTLPADAPDITKDILGNTRSGSWDIGALEFQGTGAIIKVLPGN